MVSEFGIVVVTDSLRDNGGLRVEIDYLRRWRQTGSGPLLAVVQDVDDMALAAVPPTVPVEFLSRRDSRFRFTWPRALGRLIGLARRADVVLAEEVGVGLLLAYVAARVARRPIVVFVQADIADAAATWVPRPLRPLTRWVHRRLDAAVCVADSLVTGVVANGLPADRVSVVSNGVDVAAVRELAGLPAVVEGETLPTNSPRRPDAPTVVGVGRLSPQKDFPLLVRAHAQVLAAGVDHRLVIIGEGPAEAEITAAIAEQGVTGSVRLAGYSDNPYKTMAAADLFVLSSSSEGMPLTVLEALALGTPIVATRCCTGVELLLGNGRYGDLVPVGSVEDLAAAMKRVLRDPGATARAAAGTRHALSFDVAQSAGELRAVLTGLAHPVGGRA